MKVFVYGANGNIGSKVMEGLLERGHEVYAASRYPEKGKTAANLHWVFADASTPTKGLEVLEKVDAAFFISPPGLTNQYDILNPWLEKAKTVKLNKFVLNTAMGVEYAPPEAPFRKLELALESSGLSYNIIRPNWFMQNFQTYWIGGILKDKKIYFPGGDAKVSFINVNDIADTAISLLLTDEHKNNAFALTGKEAISHSQVADKISNATGLSISYADITPEEFKKSLLSAGLPEDYADFMVYIAGSLKQGNSSPIVDSVKKITGKDPVSFDEYANENKKVWLG
ncbi:MAG: NAD(P)H-binding protein [Leptospiraceae bacterium]|nr:NAD(P)H-binding protein [Leptospiraceae bacterium]